MENADLVSKSNLHSNHAAEPDPTPVTVEESAGISAPQAEDAEISSSVKVPLPADNRITAPPTTANLPSSISQDSSAIPTEIRSSKTKRWSKVESITIENFKAIRKTTIPLGDVTILVGPNGSGKSSVLQAIQWAVRAASYISPKNPTEMMAFDRIDYLPSSDPLKTAYKGELKTDHKTSPTRVVLNHMGMSKDEPTQSAQISIWAARNKGGISVHIEGGSAVTPYKQRETFLTTYIPGLAGLSERETILAQPLLRRQAASGDAGGVLRNVLFNLSSDLNAESDGKGGANRLARLNELIQEVHPGFAIQIKFDDREDYYITATYTYQDGELVSELRPLETAATGVLQVIQIFAYLVLFRPRIMLIDEPDAHLHPDKQERLIEALEHASPEFETQVILTTHSPHIARAASPNAKLVWMDRGEVKTDDDEAIRKRLGWGGLDKSVLFFVEDKDDKPIRTILRQWPELFRRLSICRCFGIENLPKDKLLQGLLLDGNLKIKAVIHRDRDFMNNDEVEKWKQKYQTDGTFRWVCDGCDVESYFCKADYLAAIYGVTVEVAEGWRNEAANSVQKAKEKFLSKREEINRALWPTGGSPESNTLWANGGEKTPQNVLGKSLLKALKQVVTKAGYDEQPLNNFQIPASYEMALDLRSVITTALKASLPSA